MTYTDEQVVAKWEPLLKDVPEHNKLSCSRELEAKARELVAISKIQQTLFQGRTPFSGIVKKYAS